MRKLFEEVLKQKPLIPYYRLKIKEIEGIKAVVGHKNSENRERTYRGGIILNSYKLKKWLPKIKRVRGSLNISDNEFETLEGMPESISGTFDCSENKLKSLKGGPKYVGGDFICYENLLLSLEDAPKEIGGSIYVFENLLPSLKGSPKIVNGNFDCSRNRLQDLKGAPERVEGDFDCSQNRIRSLEGIPKYIGGDFICLSNVIKFSEKEIRERAEINGNVYVNAIKGIRRNFEWKVRSLSSDRVLNALFQSLLMDELRNNSNE